MTRKNESAGHTHRAGAVTAEVVLLLRGMLGLAGGEGEAAEQARVALGEVVYLLGSELWELGCGRGAGAEWAGKMFELIEGLRDGGGMRQQMLEPQNPLYRALGRELIRCFFYRGELPLGAWLKCKGLEIGEAGEEYGAIMELPCLSLRSLPDWERELWKLVKRNNPRLVEEMSATAKRRRVVAVQHCGGKTRYEVKPRKLTWKLLRPAFHRHLKRIAKAAGSHFSAKNDTP